MARSRQTSHPRRSTSHCGVREGRVTRRTSRMPSTCSSNGTILENMVQSDGALPNSADLSNSMDVDEDVVEMEHSQEYFDAPSQPVDKGKGKAIEVEDSETQVFRLMDLPTEIRLEIYRACLTRPYKILLARAEPPSAQAATSKATREIPGFRVVGGDRAAEDETESDDGDADVPAAFLALHNARLNARGILTGGPQTGTVVRRRPHARVRRITRAVDVATGFMDETTPHGMTEQAESSQDATKQPNAPPRNYASPEDPLIINILRTSKQVYKEARDVLYSENVFDVNLKTAVSSLAALHQRSRRHIKHVEVKVPTYTEILEGFSEIVRLSLRYCSGLRKFVIYTPFTLPKADAASSSNNSQVYANGFDILRWLPQQCEVILVGNTSPDIDAVVSKHRILAKSQDKLAYARRQLISSDSGPPSATLGY